MDAASLGYIENLYSDYLSDPESVEPDWRRYFDDYGSLNGRSSADGALPASHSRIVAVPQGDDRKALEQAHVAQLQDRVDQLIRGFRVRGHLAARLDPLGITRPVPPELEPESYGLSGSDFDRYFSTQSIKGANIRTLHDILESLRNTYCRSIGAQFMHIDDRTMRNWLQRRMEGSENRLDLPRDVQLRILTKLTDAEIFEGFVRKKYVGAKTFSLEGAESLIPLLDLSFEKAGEHGIAEIVIAMAHRGRLNVLANIMGKRAQNIFWEFDDPDPERNRGGGDVRYHLGYSSDWTTRTGKKLHLSLCFNPSHLEFVNPVALGRMRAKQARSNDPEHLRGMTVLIHGDASFAGEGIVQETLNLSELPGYTTGGTLHVIVNNQIGFTTPPEQGRSCTYASDIAKMLQVPIFHVNGEDPEAVAQVVTLAMDFRREFKKDVVVDMYCYRRWGHNEGDEPRFTQPLLYQAIDRRKTVREAYLDHLLQLEGVNRDEADAIAERRRDELEREFDLAQREKFRPDTQTLGGYWGGYHGGPERPDDGTQTGVEISRLSDMLVKLTALPDGFQPHRKLKRFFKQRQEMARGGKPLDWSAAEAVAMGTLATAGHRVRLSGQDVIRGTFSHRHAMIHDVETGDSLMPLTRLSADQAPVEIINSPLSEAGVLGFEYGFSLDFPEALVMWEAQFGDFWNAAQVIVDQFIASAEDKWNRLSGLVMLLPHGFEGQGPEHCSARIERWLLLTAEHNIQVAVPTTPAQYFHILRRQVLRNWLKPLVLFTPKSLLRHPRVVSQLSEFQDGRFHKVLADEPERDPASVRRIVLCMGKVYYDLLQAREEEGRDDVALIRIEQLYPQPRQDLAEALAPYADDTPVFWVQEEPANMGAWQFMKIHFGDRLFDRFPLSRISRPESASPSTGSAGSHKIEQQELIQEALGEPE